MSEKILFLVDSDVEDLELFYPLYRLKEAGFQPLVASSRRSAITGKHGYTIQADLTYGEVDTSDFKGLVLPGGRSPERVRLNEDAIKIVKDFVKRDAPIGAICHGPQILISANAVKGRRMTSWPGVKDDLIAAGAIYEDSEVVTDGNLVTSRMPSDLPSFMSGLLRILGKAEERTLVAQETEI